MALAGLSNVTIIRRRRTLLGPLTIAFDEGDFVGVVGPNGAGKSTLLNVLAGQLRPSQGTVTFDGSDIWSNPRVRKRLRQQVGYLLQHHANPGQAPLKVADVIAFGRAGLPDNNRRQPLQNQVKLALERVHLAGLEQRLFRELSGGERQKVHLARIWIRDARLLLLDEPTAGLDPDRREALTALVSDLHAEGNRTIVMVTHDLSSLPACCNRLILLKNRELLADGSPADVATEEMLSSLYGCQMAVVERNGRYHAMSDAAPHSEGGEP